MISKIIAAVLSIAVVFASTAQTKEIPDTSCRLPPLLMTRSQGSEPLLSGKPARQS
jgi:hypothetical protein